MAAGLVAASPLHLRRGAPNLQQGYRLVVNVTDPTTDFPDNPVNGLYISGEHSGAGQEAPTVTTITSAATFYTTETSGNYSIQEDISGGEPYGFVQSTTPNPSENDFTYFLGISVGGNTSGFGVPGNPLNPNPCTNAFGPQDGTFVICNDGIVDAPEAPQFVLGYTLSSGGYYDPENVPDNCVAVKLLPECAALVNTPISDEVDSLCYDNVAAIDWSVQPECTTVNWGLE